MKRDFSETSKQELLGLVAKVENEEMSDFTDWVGDRWCDFDSWMQSMGIQHCIDDVNMYHRKVIDKNNTTKQEIERIFNAVKEVDTSYAVRMSACKAQIESITNLIIQLNQIIEPTMGLFQVDNINSKLASTFYDYEQAKEILLILSQNGLSQKDIEELGEEELKDVLKRVISGIIDILPNVKVGEKIEVPIGPDVTLYYSVSGKYDNNADIDIDLVISDQRLKLKQISLPGELADAIKIGGGLLDGDVEVSGETDNGSMTFSTSGSCTGTVKYTNGNTTYTAKTKFSYQKIVFEESVATKIGEGTITSAIGIEKVNDNGWTSTLVPEYESEIVELPKLADIDGDWQDVAFVAGGLICIGGIIFAIPTGGASLGLCVL